MKNIAVFFGIVSALFLFQQTTVCQVLINTVGPAGTYSQNFNGAIFLSTSDYPLTNNAANNLGWYATRTIGNLTPNVFNADIGTGVAGEFSNYASASSTDRAYGSLADAGTGTMFYGLRLQNNTGGLIRSILVRYTGEQWRDASNSAHTLAFSYQVSAGDITSLTAGTFTNVPALNFVTPTNTNADDAIDGNNPFNRVVHEEAIFVDIPAGGEIMLRWTDVNDASDDHGMAIDDVSVAFFIPTSAPISVSGRVVTAEGRGVANVRLSLSGGSLESARYVTTNPFGYYRFDDVPAGFTYLLEASSKRYTFTTPSRVITAESNLTDFNFVTGSP